MSSWAGPPKHAVLMRLKNYHARTKGNLLAPPSSPTLDPAITPSIAAVVSTLKQKHPHAWMTFIVPSIGRASIVDTLHSLQAQSPAARWVALVIWDGAANPMNLSIPAEILADTRIAFLTLNEPKGHAGRVRNVGLSLAYTPWIGFVDDDDQLHSQYLQTLRNELVQTPHAMCVIVRMITAQGEIIPSQGTASIQKGNVGISFAIHSSVSLRFDECETEDYVFLHELDRRRVPIVLSSQIRYAIREATFPDPSVMSSDMLDRIVLHPTAI